VDLENFVGLVAGVLISLYALYCLFRAEDL
jgi:hypothetical protein